MEKLYLGDCLDVLPTLPDNSVDSIVTDPPYELGFMGKGWDNSGIAYSVHMWKECLRVLKPGGHLLSFSGTRTYHRMAVAIEDAGFEVRDMIEWCYGSGFPKSLNIGKAVDKLQGNEREVVGVNPNAIGRKENVGKFQPVENTSGGEPRKSELTKGTSEYEGWGTALKPAHEPICMARKPLVEKTVAENVLKYGTGGINIDESRVEYTSEKDKKDGQSARPSKTSNANEYTLNHGGLEGMDRSDRSDITGRFPANLLHDNSEEVRECFPDAGKGNGKGTYNYAGREYNNKDTSMFNGDKPQAPSNFNDSGNASRFFKSILYYPKASKSERNSGCEQLEKKENAGSYEFRTDGSLDGKPTEAKANFHPTVKPVELMKYLIKMVTPKGGIVLEPFAGSGSTLVAAKENGFGFIGIELTPEYIPIIEARVGVKAETINKRYLADNKILEQEIIYQKEDNEALNKALDKKQSICSCGGRIVKTKSGVLTCEDCFTEY